MKGLSVSCITSGMRACLRARKKLRRPPSWNKHVGYYLSLYTVDSIDKDFIYQLTAHINDCLCFEFDIKNLCNRMILTASVLAVCRTPTVRKNWGSHPVKPSSVFL